MSVYRKCIITVNHIKLKQHKYSNTHRHTVALRCIMRVSSHTPLSHQLLLTRTWYNSALHLVTVTQGLFLYTLFHSVSFPYLCLRVMAKIYKFYLNFSLWQQSIYLILYTYEKMGTEIEMFFSFYEKIFGIFSWVNVLNILLKHHINHTKPFIYKQALVKFVCHVERPAAALFYCVVAEHDA